MHSLTIRRIKILLLFRIGDRCASCDLHKHEATTKILWKIFAETEFSLLGTSQILVKLNRTCRLYVYIYIYMINSINDYLICKYVKKSYNLKKQIVIIK